MESKVTGTSAQRIPSLALLIRPPILNNRNAPFFQLVWAKILAGVVFEVSYSSCASTKAQGRVSGKKSRAMMSARRIIAPLAMSI